MSLAPVFKFGGTSVGNIERIEHVAELVARHGPSAVIVSAMSGETNRLVELAKSISPRTDSPEYDMLIASGEQVSVSLLSLALRKRGLKPYPMLAPTAGILTNNNYSRANILKVNKDFILSRIQNGEIPIIAGFQGVTEDGLLTTLGRGGSDTSAVAVAAGIGASACVIYTDVNGVYSADPRICPKAKILRKIHFDEMLEMASQGSKVLHIRSVHLAAKWKIKLIVKNTFTDDEGTEMTSENIEGELVTGVAASPEEAWITIGPMKNEVGLLSKVFGTLSEKGVNVDIIGQNFEPSGVSLNFTVTESDFHSAKSLLEEKFPGVKIIGRMDVAKVSIVGVGMRAHAGVAARMFQALAQANIDVLLVTTSEIKVACLIDKDKANDAVQVLHKAFVEFTD